MAVIYLVSDPSSEPPILAMGTGAVTNNSAQLYAALPNIAGPTSSWTITQWNQHSYLNPLDMTIDDSSYTDFLYGNPCYTWINVDGSVALNVYSDGGSPGTPYVYDLEQKNTSNGNDLFLSSDLPPGQIYTFSNPITYSLSARLSQATTNDGNQASPALVQVFSGFIATFNSPENPGYNPALPTIPAFIQIALSSSTSQDSRYLSFHNKEIVYTYTIPGDPSLPFASSNAPPTQLNYSLNSYLEDMIAHSSDLPSEATNLSLWSLGGMYVGSELGALGSGTASSSSLLSLQISNLSLTDDTSQTVSYAVPSAELIPGFDTSAISPSASAGMAFSRYFEQDGNIGAGSLIYSGGGNLPNAGSSLTRTLMVTAGLSLSVPGGFTAIYDHSSSDMLDLSQDTALNALFLSGNTQVTTGGVSATIYANGNDTIAGGSGSSTVYGGAGTLTFIAGSGSTNIFGGAGDVTAYLHSGDGSLTGSSGAGNTCFFGGSGDSILRSGSGTGQSILVGGGGMTTEYGGGSGPVEFVAGVNGTTVMAGQFGTGTESFFTARNTNAIMALNGADDTVVGGTGHSTVIAGAGRDLFGFLNGFAGGDETIYGLKKTDALVYGGYAGNPVVSEKVVLGADVITLVDHTKITLIGIGHTIY